MEYQNNGGNPGDLGAAVFLSKNRKDIPPSKNLVDFLACISLLRCHVSKFVANKELFFFCFYDD